MTHKMKIITMSGSYYEIVDGFWSKNGGQSERTLWAHGVPNDTYQSWAEIDAATKHEIKLGMRLYIGSRDSFWLSTEIVSIEEGVYL